MASFFDDFTGTTGALLRQRSGWSFSGSVSLQDRGTISNNRAKCGGGGGASSHYGFVRDIGDTQQFVEAKFLRNSGVGCCLYARWTSDSSFIAIRNSGSNVELIKRVAGTITSIVSVAAGLAVGDTVRLELRGTTAKLFKNGAQIGAGGGYTISDSSLQSATRVGLGGEGAVGSFEFFDDIAGGGLTVALAPVKGTHAGRADAAGVALKLRVMPADGVHAGRGDAAAVSWRGRVVAGDAFHTGRADGSVVVWRGRLAPADGYHAGRGDASAVRWRARLIPADGFHAGRADGSTVVWRGRVRPADGFHTGRGDAAGVAVRFALAAADALAAVSSDAAALRFVARTSVAAADARSVARGRAAGLTLRLRMTGARGVHALRADATAVSWRGVLRGDDGRCAVRGVARVRRPIGAPGLGEVTRVGADAGLAVFAEAGVVRVRAD